MKFTSPKNPLSEALLAALPIAPTKPSMIILGSFYLNLKGNELEIVATDLDTAIRVKVEVQGEVDGAVVVPARALAKAVKDSPDRKGDPLTVEVDKLVLTVSWGSGDATIAGADPNDFPKFPEVDEKLAVSLPRTDLTFLEGKVAFAVSHESSNQALTGVCLDIKEDRIVAVGTDGHRFGQAQVKLAGTQEPKSVIVPPKVLRDFLSAVGASEEDIAIQISETHIRFRAQTVEIASKLVEGPYPNYEAVIPSGFDRKLTASREEFRTIAGRVNNFAEDRTHQVRLAIETDSLELSANGAAMGSNRLRDRIPVEYEGEAPFHIGFNGQYLYEVLGMCSSDKIAFEMKGPTDATIIKPEGEDQGFFFLLMPLRLLDEA
jgi:DNA polymerase-3 subunit beta